MNRYQIALKKPLPPKVAVTKKLRSEGLIDPSFKYASHVNVKTPVAKCPHICISCNKTIQPKEKYVCLNYQNGFKYYVSKKLCIECATPYLNNEKHL